jgi:hypothetical protein
MEVVLEQMKQIAIKHQKEMLMEMVSEVVPKALEMVAAKSENKVDDALVLVLKEPLKQAMLELVAQIK